MKKISMSKLWKNIKALSTVVTTLIILVISVLLATVVTYFAINVVSTRVQEESLHITKHHIWHTGAVTSGGNSSVSSIMIINTGGRDIVLDKISVRGQECFWNQAGPPVHAFTTIEQQVLFQKICRFQQAWWEVIPLSIVRSL